MSYDPEPRLLRVSDVSRMYGLGRTRIYEELRAGRLKGRKCGRLTVFLPEDARDWAAKLEPFPGPKGDGKRNESPAKMVQRNSRAKVER